MNTITQLSILAGAGFGTGLFLLVRGVTPAPPSLAAALDRLHPTGTAAGRRGGIRGRAARWLLRPPAAELALLGHSRHRYALEKAAYTLAGLLGPDTLAMALRSLRLGVPLAVPTVAGLAGAAGMFFLAEVNIRQRAAQARLEFRRAVAAYLGLVGLARYSGAGAVESLEAAAAVGDGWVFQRIRSALDDARYANQAPWHRLRHLAGEIGVADLGDLGDIMALAGEQGAQVYQTLLARAHSLRVALRARDKQKAVAATTMLYVPTVMLLFAFLILIGYPAYSRIAG